MEGNQKSIDEDDCGNLSSDNSPGPSDIVDESTCAKKSSVSFPNELSCSEMRKALCKCLTEDTLAADAKWNLFIAASQSYRYDSCLRPFPPMFLTKTKEKDINSLLNVIDNVPSFKLLKKLLSCPDKFPLSDKIIELLYWVLIQMREPSLKTVPRDKFNEVLSLVPCELNAQRPDFMFKVTYAENLSNNIKWKNYKRNYNTLYAYHGSRLENFHSIVHCGLQMCFTKTPLFGQGVYLSSELLVSLPYSSTGFGWGKSLMGAELSVVALCEVLDHPSVHCQNSGLQNKERATPKDSIAGEVPHKYYVVSNSEMLRIKYLLVYTRAPPPPAMIDGVRKDSFVGWIKEHKLLTCIMGYIFLLASVGLSNNQQVIRYYKTILDRAGIQ